MFAVVCVDDRGGMMFNDRRVSRDRVVYSDLANTFKGKPIYMCEYSRSLFSGSSAPITVCDGFLEIAGDGDVCFVENRALAPYIDKIEGLVIYRWNRRYPYDMCLDIDIADMSFKLLSSKDLVGYSHEKITKEIYVR